MAKYIIGGGGDKSTYKLYDNDGKLKSAIGIADLSLSKAVHQVVLESTTPSFSGKTMTFSTIRRDITSRNFFKGVAAPVSEDADQVVKGEHGEEVTISSVAGDKSKRCLTLWKASDEEFFAAVGVWEQSSRDWGGTAGGQVNKYTWSFKCLIAEPEEIDLITSAGVFLAESGFGDGFPAIPVWDADEYIQEIDII